MTNAAYTAKIMGFECQKLKLTLSSRDLNQPSAISTAVALSPGHNLRDAHDIPHRQTDENLPQFHRFKYVFSRFGGVA